MAKFGASYDQGLVRFAGRLVSGCRELIKLSGNEIAAALLFDAIFQLASERRFTSYLVKKDYHVDTI